MGAPLPPTLGELRTAVAIRAGIATNGTLTTTVLPLVDEALNSAQKKIFLRAAWARQLVEATITVVDEQREYDLPAEASYIGDVQQLLLVSSTGVRSRLRYEDSWVYTASDTAAATKGRPTVWAYVNDVIRLDKAPDATVYPTIIAEVMASEQPLAQSQDRACVDREALVALATITVKRLLGVDFDLKNEYGEFAQYLVDLRAARVGPGRSIPIASRTADGVAYWQSGTALLGADWNPNGGVGW